MLSILCLRHRENKEKLRKARVIPLLHSFAANFISKVQTHQKEHDPNEKSQISGIRSLAPNLPTIHFPLFLSSSTASEKHMEESLVRLFLNFNH